MSDPKDNGGDGFTALSYLLAGLLLYGGLGWLADRWLGTVFLLPIGLIVGLGLGVYLIIRRFN
jgi:F0F1-type ATP synthase assembly protein I